RHTRWPRDWSSDVCSSDLGQRQYVQFMGRGVVGVAAVDGKYLWRYNKPANGTANISTPIFYENHIFAASAYDTGGGLVKLTRQEIGRASCGKERMAGGWAG